MSETERLARLAALAGIVPGFHDIWGGWHEPGEGTIRSLLGAMGVEAGDGSLVEASLASLESSDWRRVLPPVVVLARDDPLRVPVVWPADVRVDLGWTLTCEDGDVRQGRVAIDDVERREMREVDGRSMRRGVLEVPGALPLGYHRLDAVGVEGLGSSCRVVVAPQACHAPADFDEGVRAWGVTLQLYGLRSRRNWGIGDFGDLRVAVEACAGLGADFVGLSPLHAPFLAEPERVSPYSPSSRRFLNPLYLDVEAMDDFIECDAARRWRASPEVADRIARAREARFVEHPLVAALKLEAFDLLFAHFRERHLASATERGRAFRAFQADRGAALRRHAEADAAALGRGGAGAAELYEYLQWQTALRLEASAEHAMRSGMRIGLYLDLAVGVDRTGAEVTAEPEVFAVGASIGAPPDDFSPTGQSWSLPPWRPRALVEAGYEPYVQTLRTAMRAAGALRLDHVVGLLRQYWVPDDRPCAEGAYVTYPVEDLLAILALESVRHRCVVIGEDLGTVPDEMRSALHAHGVLSYRVLYFERHWNGDGSFKRPHEYPAQAMVSVSTHDLPTLAGFWTCHDLDLRDALGKLPGTGSLEHERSHRIHECSALLSVLDEQGFGPPPAADHDHGTLPDGLAEAVHAYAARTPCRLMAVQAEDLLGTPEQANLPDTVDEHPNWRRRLDVPVEAWAADARIRSVAAAIARERGRAPARSARPSTEPC